MARSDLLFNLVKFGLLNETSTFRKVVETIIAEERAKRHTVVAEKLENLLHSININNNSSNNTLPLSSNFTKAERFFEEIIPRKKISDLVLSQELVKICNEFSEEHKRIDLLRSYGIEARNRILLIGPPGNGKTSLAEAIAESLMIPFFVVKYDALVGKYLGETSMHLRSLVDYAKTRKCVLFFDEFETLAKERGDTHDSGEIKRVVSSLLLQIDSLPSHVIVIGATNHPELLDRAAWRRFQLRLNLPNPTRSLITQWFDLFQEKVQLKFGCTSETLARKFLGSNFAELEEFCTSILRRHILSLPNSDLSGIVKESLAQWKTISTTKINKITE